MERALGTELKLLCCLLSMRKDISVIIIAKNEEKKIGDCLESVKWADEIIVVDSGSEDETVDIAKKHGARVVRHTKGGFSDWRNRGAKEAKGDWLLYVDADERVTPELRREIQSVTQKSLYNAYAIPRKNIVLGKELTHGGFGKFDYVKRLFKRDKLKKWTGQLHEEPNYSYEGKITTGKKGELGHLRNKLIHIKAQALSEMVRKTNEWSEIEAKLMYEADHPPMNVPRFFSAMFREFWFRMVKKKAFLDGSIGIIHAFYQVFSRFVSYAKLWEMQLGESRTSRKSSVSSLGTRK